MNLLYIFNFVTMATHVILFSTSIGTQGINLPLRNITM